MSVRYSSLLTCKTVCLIGLECLVSKGREVVYYLLRFMNPKFLFSKKFP